MLGTLDPSQELDWNEYLESLTHAYNCTLHDSTGHSPFFLMFMRHPRLLIDLAFDVSEENTKEADYSEYVADLRSRLQWSCQEAVRRSDTARERQKRNYDKSVNNESVLQPGDRVLVADKTPVIGKHKLRDKWESMPYVVISKRPGVPVYVIQSEDGVTQRTLHRNMLKLCMFLTPTVKDPSSEHLGDLQCNEVHGDSETDSVVSSEDMLETPMMINYVVNDQGAIDNSSTNLLSG
ncbi:uncharacterized protein [Ptychodera flava]|uniref:uncharacterized protein n=1 Tax=Ptychodera flava TaxID=63121 RepID=UPI003969D18E